MSPWDAPARDRTERQIRNRLAQLRSHRTAGLVAIVLGVLLAMVQANTRSSSSPLWVTIFIGIALIGIGLRIEAATFRTTSTTSAAHRNSHASATPVGRFSSPVS
jgi:uncharacterized membrane protein